MKINYLSLKGIVPIVPKLPEIEYARAPLMMGVVSHDSDKLVDIVRLSKLGHEPVRRIMVVEDNTIISLGQILEDAKVYTPSIAKSLSEEIELIRYNMDRQASESQTKDFISEKQKEHWLKDRMNRPNKHYTSTRNKMK